MLKKTLIVLALMLNTSAILANPSMSDTTASSTSPVEMVTKPRAEIESILDLVDRQKREIAYLNGAVASRDSMISFHGDLFASMRENFSYLSSEYRKKNRETWLIALASLAVALGFSYVASNFE